MSLEKKITRLTVGIFLAVLVSISIFSLMVIDTNMTDALEKRLIDTAFVIAANPMIQTELAEGSDPTHLKVQNFVERMRLKVDLLFITVIDMDGVRYSHPIPDNIGRKFLGGDEKIVLEMGESYVSEGEGHLGNSIRAFVPVYKDGVQVGAVSIGILKRDFREEVRLYFMELVPVFIIALAIIIFLAKKLAKNIKDDIYGFEPEEIAIQLREKESIINNMEEGLISVNNLGEVTVINKKALDMLRIEYKEDVDEKIMDLLNKVIYRRSGIFNEEIRISEDIVIMANFYSIVGEYGKGLDLLKWVRLNEIQVDTILVTADKGRSSVDEAFKYGAVDYLIKPFKYDRFKEALLKYRERVTKFKKLDDIDQQSIDEYILKRTSNSMVKQYEEAEICKGLNIKTYNKIIEFMNVNKGVKLSAEEIANGSGLARVTARRYLEKMDEEKKVEIIQEYGRIGRPTKFYTIK